MILIVKAKAMVKKRNKTDTVCAMNITFFPFLFKWFSIVCSLSHVLDRIMYYRSLVLRYWRTPRIPNARSFRRILWLIWLDCCVKMKTKARLIFIAEEIYVLMPLLLLLSLVWCAASIEFIIYYMYIYKCI